MTLRLSPRFKLVLLHAMVLAATVATVARAQTEPGKRPDAPVAADPRLQRCGALDVAAERLACYDRLSGRMPPSDDPPAAAPAAVQVVPGTPPSAASSTDLINIAPGMRPSVGFLSQFWELDPETKRGTFNFIGYRPNFILPLHYTSRINRSPSSPTRAAVDLPDYRQLEAKLQISLRTKVAQSVLLPGADIWFGYTQQSLWQVWNRQASAPFRNTDYEPEAMYVVPVRGVLQDLPFGWRWKYVQAAIAHQSNGQAKPLSRSWNRVYLGTGVERGDYSLVVRLPRRLPESAEQDDNPDLTAYRGRGDIQLNWTPGLATASLQYRSTFHSLKRGALQFDWTYPVDREQPGGLRWYAQVFTGYGETLTDYNFRQTSVGLGLTLFEF